MVELLLDKGDIVDAECADGKTALHYAAQMGHEAIVNRLLSVKGTELVNRPDEAAWTPLHYAAEHGSLQLVHTFLEVRIYLHNLPNLLLSQSSALVLNTSGTQDSMHSVKMVQE